MYVEPRGHPSATGIDGLSAFCGAVCAGAAAGAGIAYLDGGGYCEACHAVVNALSIVPAGMVCDGAKPSCAGKIAFSVNAGILGYVTNRDASSTTAATASKKGR